MVADYDEKAVSGRGRDKEESGNIKWQEKNRNKEKEIKKKGEEREREGERGGEKSRMDESLKFYLKLKTLGYQSRMTEYKT